MPTPGEFRANVIRPTLEHLGLHSPAAEELLLGTAMQESDLVHRRQIGGGPGRGYFQMEPNTHNDIWENYLKFRSELAAKVKQLLSSPTANRIEELEKNDRYGCAMARVLYRRAPDPLPAAGDVAAMAAYWKKFYNTPLGAGRVQQYIDKWKRAFPD